jgi:hypothetical protein
VGLAAVVGGECSGWAAGEVVDEHGEGESEESLGDALGESGEGLGEMGLHSHLALQGGEHGLDHEADSGLGDLGQRALPEFVFVGDDQIDVDEFEAVVVLAAAVPGVGEHKCSGVRGRELVDALAFVLVGCSEVIAEGRAVPVADQK